MGVRVLVQMRMVRMVEVSFLFFSWWVHVLRVVMAVRVVRMMRKSSGRFLVVFRVGSLVMPRVVSAPETARSSMAVAWKVLGFLIELASFIGE